MTHPHEKDDSRKLKVKRAEEPCAPHGLCSCGEGHAHSHAIHEDDYWPPKLKRTKQRTQLLALLRESKQPLSAGQLFLILHTQGDQISLSTVYRNLEALREAALLRVMSLPGDDTQYYEMNRGGHTHYAVCEQCHQIFPLSSCPLPADFPDLVAQGFQVTGHKLELYGICAKCQE